MQNKELAHPSLVLGPVAVAPSPARSVATSGSPASCRTAAHQTPSTPRKVANKSLLKPKSLNKVDDCRNLIAIYISL